MKRAPMSEAAALEREIRRLQGDGREVSPESKAWARDVASMWLEQDVRAMLERGKFVDEDDPPEPPPAAPAATGGGRWRTRAAARAPASAPRRSVERADEHQHANGVTVCMQCPGEVIEAWRRRDEVAEARELVDDSIAWQLAAGDLEARHELDALADVVELPRTTRPSPKTRRAA